MGALRWIAAKLLLINALGGNKIEVGLPAERSVQPPRKKAISINLLGGIYGKQIYEGEFDLKLSLFGLPFLLGTIVIGSFALLTLCGRVEARVT